MSVRYCNGTDVKHAWDKLLYSTPEDTGQAAKAAKKKQAAAAAGVCDARRTEFCLVLRDALVVTVSSSQSGRRRTRTACLPLTCRC